MRINLTKKDIINAIYMQIGFSKKIADNLFRNENTWRYPCKNLVNDGEICEL